MSAPLVELRCKSCQGVVVPVEKNFSDLDIYQCVECGLAWRLPDLLWFEIDLETGVIEEWKFEARRVEVV